MSMLTDDVIGLTGGSVNSIVGAFKIKCNVTIVTIGVSATTSYG